jgi:NADH-quinone oxidoreductase subunit H
VRLRWSVILFTLLGFPALFFGASWAFYMLAALGEKALMALAGVHGGGGIVNSVTLMVLVVLTFGGLLTIGDRKWGSAIQDRIGPNRANLGPIRTGGIPHFLADAVKMLTKEDFLPERANRFIFGLAPAAVFIPVVALFAVVPVAPKATVLGEQVALQVASPDFGILFIFAMASLAVYGTTLAGWSSNNKLAILGGVRASSQMISYEVALGLSVIGIMMVFSTLKLDAMTDAQAAWLWGGQGGFDIGLPAWGIFLQPFGFVLFFAAAFAESKRPPFDMPEGESEIVGYFVEYSGMRFGLFMISEYIEVVVLAGVMAALFFGGYHLPFGEQWLLGHIGQFWLAVVLAMTFWLKVLFLSWVQLMVRWTFPRFRYDQVMKLGWRMLLPAGLVNVFLTGALMLIDPTLRLLAIVGMIEIVVILVMVFAKAAPEPAAVTDHGHGGHGHAAADHGHGAAAAH